jgi:hypothetical protein
LSGWLRQLSLMARGGKIPDGWTEAMSALGQKQTSALQKVMSALPPKADMCGATRDVRFGPKADLWLFITPTKWHVVVPNLTSAVTAAQAILKNLG